MNMSDYQREAANTAVFPKEPEGVGLYYCTMKLCGEAGEHAEKVAKLLRGDYEGASENDMAAYRHNIVQELGDVMWYVAMLASMYGYSLTQVAEMNLAKLQDRKKRGVLKGSGDKR